MWIYEDTARYSLTFWALSVLDVPKINLGIFEGLFCMILYQIALSAKGCQFEILFVKASLLPLTKRVSKYASFTSRQLRLQDIFLTYFEDSMSNANYDFILLGLKKSWCTARFEPRIYGFRSALPLSKPVPALLVLIY